MYIDVLFLFEHVHRSLTKMSLTLELYSHLQLSVLVYFQMTEGRKCQILLPDERRLEILIQVKLCFVNILILQSITCRFNGKLTLILSCKMTN